MGNYKAVHRNVDNTKLPRMYPEPDYEIKTRPPVNVGNTWRQNILLRVREEQLSDEAMPLARRKCYDPIIDFAECHKKQGLFWYVFNCQEEFHYVSECLEHEFKVEMDRRRRDIDRNPERWWKNHYSQQGEVGIQATTEDCDPTLLQSIKFMVLGDSKVQIKL